MLLENYTFFQGLYMSAITISTVGYGEVKPLSPKGQMFSIVLIFISIIGLAMAGRALGESLLENAWRGNSEKRRMQRKIQALRGHHLICGYGRVGHAAAAQLAAAKASFVIMDQVYPTDLEPLETNYLFIEGDATREQPLLEAGIKHAKGLLALLGSDPENVFLVLTARELNPTLRIIARANDPSVESRLHKAGADTVISPFTTAGIQVANEILLATGEKSQSHTMTDLPNTPHWLVIQAEDSLVDVSVGRAIKQIGGTILGLRRGNKDYLTPAVDDILKVGDSLLVMGTSSGSTDIRPVSQEIRQVVIIDDNPVIVKLYTRLFKKAGFIPYTAADGRKGLDLILQLKPTAAVIDFMLPIFSGIDICAKVRANRDLDDTHLILFTADNNEATRKRALAAGADAVVVKSPDANEVVETVLCIIAENPRQ
jgi:voltage-gated potassium channel